MKDEENKVKFQGKKMNLLEARLYLYGLGLGIVKTDLKEEEMEDYLKWENKKFIKNKQVKELTEERIFKKDNKKHYLIEELESQIKSIKNAKKVACCQKKGHKETKDFSTIKPYMGGAIVNVLCSRCGFVYERKPTPEELEKAKKTIYNPFQS